LPPFSLSTNHSCPKIKEVKSDSFSRIFNQELNGRWNKTDFTHHRQWMYGKMKYQSKDEILLDEDLTCISCYKEDNIFMGTERGEIYTNSENSIFLHDSMIDRIEFNSNFRLFTTWNTSYDSQDQHFSLLWDVNKMSADGFLYQFENATYTTWNHSGNVILASENEKMILFDVETCKTLNQIPSPLDSKDSIAYFNHYDDLILRDNIIYDFRIPTRKIHQ
jgi:hypothetical protein